MIYLKKKVDTKKKKVKEEKKETFSVLGHIFVPKHEVVPPKDYKSLCNKFNTRLELFPHILFSDPAIRELDAKSTDLIKITRKSETAGETVYYRYVVG